MFFVASDLILGLQGTVDVAEKCEFDRATHCASVVRIIGMVLGRLGPERAANHTLRLGARQARDPYLVAPEKNKKFLQT